MPLLCSWHFWGTNVVCSVVDHTMQLIMHHTADAPKTTEDMLVMYAACCQKPAGSTGMSDGLRL